MRESTETQTKKDSLSPELREVISRLRDREPELQEIVEEWPEPEDDEPEEGGYDGEEEG